MSDGERLENTRRGVLYPARLPTFDRIPAPPEAARLVRWFWIPEWDIAPGRSSRQHLIAFPACNLVVEMTGVFLAGPTTGSSHRDLTGTGWAVGALLRPAAVPFLTADPAAARDTYRPVDLPGLHERVAAAMTGAGDRHRDAVGAFTSWLTATVGEPDEEALLANTVAEVIDADPEIRTVVDAAARLGLGVRSLQRLAARYIGLPPLAMIRRRRLQEAAERLRADPQVTLAAIAADLGYSDHAHLANEFRDVLGLTLGAYRRSGRAAPRNEDSRPGDDPGPADRPPAR